jgi:hypothetical protein
MRANKTKIKNLLNLSSKLIPILALSLTILTLAGGRVSAASVNQVVSSSELGLYDPDSGQTMPLAGLTTEYPLDYSSLSSGGNYWSFGPDTQPSGTARRYETFKFPSVDCASSANVEAINYKVRMRINDLPSDQGALWLVFEPNSVFSGVDVVNLSHNDASANFIEYTASISGPFSLSEAQDYGVAIMYESQDVSPSFPALSVDVDEISRDITYDDSACPTTPTPPNPTPGGGTPTTPTNTTYCSAPGNTTQALTPEGDCDGDGITNKEEGYDPDGDGNPSTGTPSVDTDKDGTPDYLDPDSDNDTIPDKTEGTKDTNNNGIPAFRDPSEGPKTLANTGYNLSLILVLSLATAVGGLGLKRVVGRQNT